MNRINRSWVDVNRLGSPVTNSMIEVKAASSLDRVIAERDALQQRLTAADERIDELTKPQGEQMACMPVDRSYDVRAKMIIAFNEAKKTGGDLDDALNAAYKSALRYSPCRPTAEQPKPAATTIDYGSLDAVQRLALCRGDAAAPVAVVQDGYCIMPRQLTAENGAKALLLGEFKLLVTKECPECCDLEEPAEGCSICDGEGEHGQTHTIPWDKIKFIYSKAVEGLAVKAETAISR
jgi:hypothetical protein